MSLFLPQITRLKADEIRDMLSGNNGEALVVSHPHMIGITADEEEQGFRKTEINAGSEPGTDLLLRWKLRPQNQTYKSRFRQALADSPDPLGFVFECVGQQEASIDEIMADTRLLRHVAYLESIDPHKRLWIVIPTREAGPDPILYREFFPADSRESNPVIYNRYWVAKGSNTRKPAWNATLQAMASLGLRYAYVGGCFLAVDRNGQPINPNHFYSCLNHLGGEILMRGLFGAEFKGEMMYVQLIPERLLLVKGTDL